MELIRPVLVAVLLLGLCYTLVQCAPTDMGGNDAIPGLPNEKCELDVDLNTTRCSNPDNVNSIVDDETESSLPLCDCPGDSECIVVKIGEIYKCQSPKEQAAQKEDLLQFSQNMLLDED